MTFVIDLAECHKRIHNVDLGFVPQPNLQQNIKNQQLNAFGLNIPKPTF